MSVASDLRAVVVGMGPVGCGITRLLVAAGTPPAFLVDPHPSEAARAFGIPVHPALTRDLLRDALHEGAASAAHRMADQSITHAVRVDDAAAWSAHDIPREQTMLRRMIVLAVPDRLLAEVADACAPLLDRDEHLVVVHTSGARGADVLSPLAALGVRTGMFHPAQSFPHTALPLERLRNVTCGIEAAPATRPWLADLARHIGWRPVQLRADRIALYHAACVLTGNVLPAIMLAADRMLASSLAGDEDAAPAHAFDAMTASVLAEVIAHDAAASITGPARRADLDTIAAHLAVIADTHPELLDFYRVATALITQFAPLSPDQRDAVLRLLDAG